MAKRAQIQPERLGRNLRAHDVLMPVPEADPAPGAVDDIESSKHLDAKAAKLQREPTTIRFTKATLKELARTRSHLLIEQDLKVTQSDLVETAVLHALRDLEGLAKSLRESC